MVPRSRWRRAAVLGLLGALTLAGCANSSAAANNDIKVYASAERKAAPTVAGTLLDGASYRLADHLGQVVVVNFWESYCAPCRVEADDLEQTYQATKDSGVTFLGVNIRDDRDKAKAFVLGRATYPSIFDPAGRMGLDFSVPPTVVPTTFVLDRQGRIAAVIRRAVLVSELTPLVTQIAAEPLSG
jgi:thiol-disulfide isomerase/thioredoxin